MAAAHDQRPEPRYCQLEATYRSRIARCSFVRYEVDGGDVRLAEREAIDRLQRIAAGRPYKEVFEGLPYGVAATLVRQLSRRRQASRACTSRWSHGAAYWQSVLRCGIANRNRRGKFLPDEAPRLEVLHWARLNLDADPRFRTIVRERIERRHAEGDGHAR